MFDCPIYRGCNYTFLSCRFIDHLKKGKFVFVNYNSSQEAQSKFLHNEIQATLEFSSNYSDALVNRLENAQSTLDEDVEASELFVLVDNSEYWTRQLIEKQIRDSFTDFMNDILRSCNYSSKLAKVAMDFQTPIYGSLEANFQDFAGASLIAM